MKITYVDFVKSVLTLKEAPRDGRLEVAFAGRSNVGKSSLLNAIFNRKNLAKTSNTPGKTRTLNFYDVNRRYYFVDLPGYGYAEVSRTLKEQWNKLMFEYLSTRKTLRLVVVLLDARHGPTENDHQLLDLLEEQELPTLLVATKIDKLSNNQRKVQLDKIREELQLDEEAVLLPFSAVTKEGVVPLLKIIGEVLTGRS